MRAGLADDRRGAAALEFALVAPVFVLMVLGALLLGFGFWTRNALQQSATEAARCIAIKAPPCTGAAGAGCASGGPGFCYLAALARKRGVGTLAADQVTIDTAAVRGGASFTAVTVAYPFAVLGRAVVLRAEGHFPNPP